MRHSPDRQSVRVPPAGDAILRLLATVVVDAIDVAWKRQNTPVSIFGRDGPLCEAKAATRSVKNKRLAVLFDKLDLCSWYPMDSRHLSERGKGTIVEYLVVKLYEIRGGNTRLAELVLACMIQCLVWFAIYDIQKKRSQIPFILRCRR